MIDKIEALMPKDPLMHIAWVSGLMFCAKTPEIQDRFLKDTGLKLQIAKNPLDRLIDEASGFNEDVALKFAAWYNENVWGIEGEEKL